MTTKLIKLISNGSNIDLIFLQSSSKPLKMYVLHWEMVQFQSEFGQLKRACGRVVSRENFVIGSHHIRHHHTSKAVSNAEIEKGRVRDRG